MDANLEPIQVIAELIRCGLGLPLEAVSLYNQKQDLPPSKGLFVNVGLLYSKPFGLKADHYNDSATGALNQLQTVNLQEAYSVLLFSYDSSARRRYFEIPFALTNDEAQRAYEQYAMKVSRLPAMTDVSEVEGTKRLNRYSLTVRALVAYEKVTQVPYYATFTDRIITNE